jgi:hypothetical protein
VRTTTASIRAQRSASAASRASISVSVAADNSSSRSRPGVDAGLAAIASIRCGEYA